MFIPHALTTPFFRKITDVNRPLFSVTGKSGGKGKGAMLPKTRERNLQMDILLVLVHLILPV